MSTITPNYQTVKQLLQSQSFSIDEYQREYKWETENINELINDLYDKFLHSYQEGHETNKVSGYEDYFLGSIIISKRNGKNYIIDGQQRITSLTLLLIYLHNAAKEKGLNVYAQIAPLIFSDNFGTPSFNLDIQERLPVIEALFHQQDFNPDGKDESIQTMYARYEDIATRGLVEELGDAFPHFVYWLISKVGMIEISTDNDNYAYSIFETMNDRGKPLSPVDMLKAYVLAPIEDAEQRRTANQIWKKQVLELISWEEIHEPERDAAMIKAWFRAQYAETMRDRKAGAADKDWELIGSAFHRWVRNNHERLSLGTSPSNFRLISQDFTFFAKAYKIIVSASYNYQKGLEAIYYNAHNQFTWQNTVLLAPLCPIDDEETVRKKMAVTASYLDIWLMRRVVNYIRVGYSSTAYTMFRLCTDIRQKPLNELVSILQDKLANDDVTFAGNERRGRVGIKGLKLNQFSRRYIYHLLARVNSFVESQAGKPDLFDKDIDRSRKNACDIEHICPNTYAAYAETFDSEPAFQEWRNHVAGLLLLPADVNRSYQDKPFKDKSPYYAQHNLFAASLTPDAYQHQPQFKEFIARYELPFQSYSNFGVKEQGERRELLEQLANLIWSPERLVEAAQ